MSRKLIIDGNAVYEIDEKCMLKKKLGELKEKKITSDETAPFEVEEGTDISIRHSCSHYRNRRIRIHYCPIRRSSKEEG